MKKIINIRLLAILLILVSTTEVFSQFIISGEFRPRAEYRDGYKKLNAMTDEPVFFVSQRTRLILSYKTNRFKTFLSLQDVRNWGSQKQLVGNENNAFSVHEAWGEVFFAKSKVMSMKLGRQEIVLDDHRIFGSVGWAQQARSHDALIFKYNNAKVVDIQAGLAFNVLDIKPSGYKTMQYLWANKKMMDNKLSVSLLALNLGKEATDRTKTWHNYTQTFGTHTTLKLDTVNKFKVGLNAYYQMGKMDEYNGSGTDPRDLSAYLLGIDMSYNFSKKFSMALGYELQSGNSKTDTTAAAKKVNKAFTPFFGTNHKFNGFMDYFYVGNHTGSVGLQDIYLKAKFNNMKGNKIKFYVGGDFHAFLSSSDILDTKQDITKPFDLTKSVSPFLGTELDLYFGFPITKGINFNFGHSTMFGTESMEILKGSGDRKQFNNWSYMQIVFKPTFFDSSKFEWKKKK